MILKYPHTVWKTKTGKLNGARKNAIPRIEFSCDECNKVVIEKENVFNARIEKINKELCGSCSRPYMSSIAGLKSNYDESGNLKPNSGRFNTEKWNKLSKKEQQKRVKNANKGLHDKLNNDPEYKNKHYKKIFKNSKIGYISKAQREIYEILKNDGYELDGCVGHMKVDIINKEKKIAIEYNGDYWHCNPRTWDEYDYNKAIKMTAKEKWNLDRRRYFALRKLGYEVHVIWEIDWNKNRNKVYDLLRKITHVDYKFEPWIYVKKGSIKGKTYEEIYGEEVAKIKKEAMSKRQKNKKMNTTKMWEIVTPNQGIFYVRRLYEWRNVIKKSYSKLIKYNKIEYSKKYKMWDGKSFKLDLNISCPHCDMVSTSINNMNRYHFDNCKLKK